MWYRRPSRSQTVGKGRDISRLLKLYRRVNKPRLDALLNGFRNFKTLEETIRIAALGIDANGKRHGHQRRLSKSVLERAAAKLRRAIDEIASSHSFDDLLDTVQRSTKTLKGFGELARYDTALRIGAHMGIYPTKVYLHAGTRKGARALGFRLRSRDLEIAELPMPLQNLPAHEIENFLCIYKEDLEGEHRLSRKRGGSCGGHKDRIPSLVNCGHGRIRL